MATDQPDARTEGEGRPILGDNRGWGSACPSSPGATTWTVPAVRLGRRLRHVLGFDPKEEMVAILMTQRLWDSPGPRRSMSTLWTSAYQAIED